MDGTQDNRRESCSSPDGLVSYLYGETNAAERSKFESHLAGCDDCAAEFAELSFARLDVYEWNRDEFAVMPSPTISIPYTAKSKTSLVDSVRGWFVFPARLAAAGGFAVLAVAAGVWFLNPSAPEIVQSIPDAAPGPANIQIVQKSVPATGPQITGPSSTSAEPGGTERTVRKSPAQARTDAGRKPVPLKASERSVHSAGVDKAAPRKIPVRRNAAPPSLNEFEDEDDNTLRLGDLLAEVDTKE